MLNLSSVVLGDAEENHRLLGKLLKDYSAEKIRRVLVYMKDDPPVDPKSYLVRSLRGSGLTDKQRAKAEAEAESRARAAEAAAPEKLKAMNGASRDVPKGHVLEIVRQFGVKETRAIKLAGEYVKAGNDPTDRDGFVEFARGAIQ